MKNDVHARAVSTLGKGPSLEDSYPDYTEHRVSPPNHNGIIFFTDDIPNIRSSVVVKKEWTGAAEGGFCVFFFADFARNHGNTLLWHLCNMVNCLWELFPDDHKQKSSFLLDSWLCTPNFWESWVRYRSPLVWLWFQLWFKVSDPSFINSNNPMREYLSFSTRDLWTSTVTVPETPTASISIPFDSHAL